DTALLLYTFTASISLKVPTRSKILPAAFNYGINILFHLLSASQRFKLILSAIQKDQHGSHIDSLLLHKRGVKTNQRLSLLHLVSLGNQSLKALSLQSNRINADMHHQLKSIVPCHAKRMKRLRQHGHRSVTG